MKSHKSILMSLLVLLMVACGSKDTIEPPVDKNNLIDRAGRPYMTELFVGPFRDATARNTFLNDYNVTPTDQLLGNFQKEVSRSLAAYDALHLVVGSTNSCGDNSLTNRKTIESSSPLATNINRYDAFSKLLLDDQIYINRNAGPDCNIFMAVELAKMGLTNDPGGIGDPNSDCGGHLPFVSMDVIKTYYSVAIPGVSTAVGAVDDGVTTTQDAGGGIQNESFPFLAQP